MELMASNKGQLWEYSFQEPQNKAYESAVMEEEALLVGGMVSSSGQQIASTIGSSSFGGYSLGTHSPPYLY